MGKWGYFDLKLAEMRINRIKKYIPKNSILLDIGCGYHYKLLKLLKNHIKEGHGVDLKVSKSREDNLYLYNVDLTKDKIPIKDEYVDVVTMLAVIEHLNNPTHILNEIHRVLKNNGILLMTTPTPPSKPVLEFLGHIGIIDLDEILDHKIYYSKKMLLDTLNSHGFKVIRHNYFQFGFNQYVVAKKV